MSTQAVQKEKKVNKQTRKSMSLSSPLRRCWPRAGPWPSPQRCLASSTPSPHTPPSHTGPQRSSSDTHTTCTTHYFHLSFSFNLEVTYYQQLPVVILYQTPLLTLLAYLSQTAQLGHNNKLSRFYCPLLVIFKHDRWCYQPRRGLRHCYNGYVKRVTGAEAERLYTWKIKLFCTTIMIFCYEDVRKWVKVNKVPISFLLQ